MILKFYKIYQMFPPGKMSPLKEVTAPFHINVL